MAFQVPNRVPAFNSAQREIEDGYWRAATTNSLFAKQSGIQLSEKIGNFITPSRELPMYKDKPYFQSRGRNPVGRKRKKALWITICVVFLVSLWWFLGGRGGHAGIVRPIGMKGGEMWKWVQGFEKGVVGGKGNAVDWEERRQRVKDAFLVSWGGYEQDAWGKDVYQPLARTGSNMVEDGIGWIIVDTLDTLMLMNLTTQVQNARKWIRTSLHYQQDQNVNTFETTIRMLGGLLSAHYLSKKYPTLAPLVDDDEGAPGDDLYIEKATGLADRLLGAFDSPSGIPYASLNLNSSHGVPSHTDNGASSTAEAGSLQLEFKYLAKLTGESHYWEKVEKVMEVIDGNEMRDGLLPIFILADTGKFMGENIRLGSRGDSYYEYLIKQFLQTSGEEPIYQNMWDQALAGIRKHLITYTKHASLTLVAERPSGLDDPLVPKMDHLVCFLPGTIALGATGGLPLSKARKSPGWNRQKEDEIVLAKELVKTCWATYLATETGLAPEIAYYEVDKPPRMMEDVFPRSKSETKAEKGGKGKERGKGEDIHIVSKPLEPLDDKDSAWRKDVIIKPADRHNLQRPETIESLFYLYRITEDEMYREWGWEMFKNFVKHTAVIEEATNEQSHEGSSESSASHDDSHPSKSSYIRAFTSLANADMIPPRKIDNMESFWLAETLKYFYLLFSDKDFIPLTETVFNTEAHIFPRFKMGKLFKTGWKRKTEWKAEE
ncbi:endoplasmic reticulum mannosyl-oligosaccharide 1,2-alpha-mannosidase [Arthroderma uncinatum]|uniref:endoplasmic reticulum mannosyl-oligosaccharide 1,2-alpha-mannosidase n=1 Tax=Arthroderma uncinatum TaxID=74035 RepID=UPI00144A99BC|nr:endoplasmic reticulum mannosyl-oligosaccharide 1,2-alpha-mannosidase [Arthroderma uncinatum]KAF3481663.1 endoplasmic reticulum mannosyl-oligosaccharide 1,2-alpha-mannosidase [Arthroderma uncinatum]